MLDLKTHKKPAAEFLVLLPHRDSLKVLENFRKTLFASGLQGAYSFPPAIPLAQLSGPLNHDELGKIAAEIRKLSLINEGKISANDSSLVEFPREELFENCAFYGPHFDLTEIDSLSCNEKVMHSFPAYVLCAGLIGPDDERILEQNGIMSAPGFDPISFRAAQLANLSVRRLETGASALCNAVYSNEWRFGLCCWLPSHKRKYH